jgi:hypothetical protein
VKDLRRIAVSDPHFPPPVFIFMGEVDAGSAFLDRLWPVARGIADPQKRLYDAFGVERGGVKEMFGPGAFVCGVRAAAKGNFVGRKHGDPWTLPSFVLVDGDEILWRHDGAHAGDHPAWSEVLEQVRR